MSGSILITGATGQLGHELANWESRHRLIPLSRPQLDITDPAQIAEAFLSHQPDLVINAAAYTQVDRAEQEPELAFAINRDAVANLARACRKSNIPLLHVSTDYVFDGSKPDAYRETDPVAPLGIYGQSKAEGEIALAATLEQHISLRTSWVFSATGNNFVKTMLRLGKERDEIGIVNDQRGCPTSARSIAEVLMLIADRYLRGDPIQWGCYHYCNQPETTWFEFAGRIFQHGEEYRNLKLNPITTKEYPTPAQRPMNSILDCQKLTDEFGIQQANWAEELDAVCTQLAIQNQETRG